MATNPTNPTNPTNTPKAHLVDSNHGPAHWPVGPLAQWLQGTKSSVALVQETARDPRAFLPGKARWSKWSRLLCSNRFEWRRCFRILSVRDVRGSPAKNRQALDSEEKVKSPSPRFRPGLGWVCQKTKRKLYLAVFQFSRSVHHFYIFVKRLSFTAMTCLHF